MSKAFYCSLYSYVFIEVSFSHMDLYTAFAKKVRLLELKKVFLFYLLSIYQLFLDSQTCSSNVFPLTSYLQAAEIISRKNSSARQSLQNQLVKKKSCFKKHMFSTFYGFNFIEVLRILHLATG